MPKAAKAIPTVMRNVHPVDELHALREDIKAMQKEADRIRDSLLEEGADLRGDHYVAKLIPSKRESVDMKALKEAFGEEFLKPFLKTTEYVTVKTEGK